MVSAIVARVGPHTDLVDLAKHSSVPIINALSDAYHPMQIIADYLTMLEAHPHASSPGDASTSGLGLDGLKIAWVGDASNVLVDLAIGAMKLGLLLTVAAPAGYGIPASMKDVIRQAGVGVERPGSVMETNVPEEAVKDADVVLTDTWVSMGQEEEKSRRIKAFQGFQVTSDLLRRGGAKADWKFMHCLPRHQEEVSDEVFYGPRSMVFREAENRLWAAMGRFDHLRRFMLMILPIRKGRAN